MFLTTAAVEIERMFSNGPIDGISLFGDRLSKAIQGSQQWKKERALGEVKTTCWTTMIPHDPKQDISITIWLGRKEGHQLSEDLMMEPTWSRRLPPKHE
jgi:hypothetical protein